MDIRKYKNIQKYYQYARKEDKMESLKIQLKRSRKMKVLKGKKNASIRKWLKTWQLLINCIKNHFFCESSKCTS